MTQNETTDETAEQDSTVSRRGVIASLAGIGVLGAGIGYGAGSASAAPSGTIGSSTNPYLRAYVDRQVYVARTTDPSGIDDGTTWYREDL